MAGCDCAKKVHTDQARAIAAALRNSKRFGCPFRAYQCPTGNGWHLTTKPLRINEVNQHG